MTGHRRIPSKIIISSSHYSVDPTIEQSLIIEVEEKPY